MLKDLLDGFYLYSPVNNTFVQIDSRNNRIAVEKIYQAKRFHTEEEVNNYIELMCEDGNDFLNFYKVVRGQDFKDTFIDTTSWPHYSLAEFDRICKELGVTDKAYFRGRIAHMISLLKNDEEDEFIYEMLEVRNNEQETQYP